MWNICSVECYVATKRSETPIQATTAFRSPENTTLREPTGDAAHWCHNVQNVQLMCRNEMAARNWGGKKG